jgi:hypothetical protein
VSIRRDRLRFDTMASRTVSLLVVLALAALGCSGQAPETPSRSSYPVYVEYHAPAAGTLPPPTIDDAMCYHHYAPSNLAVSTSWGGQGRLEATGTDTYGLLLPNVPVNQDLWVAFLDISLCPTGSIYVTRGVTANGTTLTTVKDAGGVPALSFRLDARGTIVP